MPAREAVHRADQEVASGTARRGPCRREPAAGATDRHVGRDARPPHERGVRPRDRAYALATGNDFNVGMRWQNWLARWDRHNQAVLSGEIPEEIRARWRWDRSPDDSGRERLVLGRVVLDDGGIQTRLARTRAWPWERIAYLTWEYSKYSSVLAVCLRGDPYVRSLNFGHRDPRVC